MVTQNYLQKCFYAFREISEKKYGTPFNLPAIEQAVSSLRNSKKPLTFSQLHYFMNPSHWWFERYWVWPPEEHVGPGLGKIRFNLRELSARNEKEVIRQLLDVFKSIELASIILRFIHPKNYGILSTPVERVLNIPRGLDAVETYLNYLDDLRAITRHYNFKRSADADMALWVLHEKCFGEHLDHEIKLEFDNDSYMNEVLAKNLLSPLLKMSAGQLARALKTVKTDLAEIISCISFEHLVKEFSQARGAGKMGKLSEVIKRLNERGLIGGDRYLKWKMFRDIRNDLFHEKKRPTSRQLDELVRELEQLEREVQEGL